MASKASERISAEGANYGEMILEDRRILMKSATNGYRILDCPMEQMSLCVIPASNRDEIEIHFHDKEKLERDENQLAQITFHFPPSEDPEDEETPAEIFRKSIMSTGLIRSVTGDIIAEFTKDQGNFVSPRGKYAIQMMATYMHMQGAQYSYKINYEDINSLFLLPKPDGNRNAFVISLEKPIRQGTQKYFHLIWEAHKIDTTININLTKEEILSKYGENSLEPEMTMPLSSLIAKVFKVLSQTIVFVPKQFISARNQSSIRCNLKANEGLLYPLAKSLIFINKPTILIKFEDIESVEFLRYEAQKNSATRNFDLQVTLKPDVKSDVREYTFSSIDRSEYGTMFDFFTARNLNVIVPEGAKQGYAENDDEESDDESYNGAESDSSASGSGSGSDDDDDDDGDDSGSGSGSDNGSEGESDKKKGKEKKRKSSSSKADKPKGKRAKKDKDAPKGGKSAYILFGTAIRSKILEENPGIKATEVLKEVANRWKVLPSEEKQVFEEESKKDKERAKLEMQKYKASKGDN